ncbi:FAD-dependent monooxygenase [Sanguibacter sp. 25GB23B1]|uniref:FAD-dependent monooxygenase n=1 Tax=unclassified Sanguibacter TaxID=2645534 RepID=UPI0032AEC62D
MDGERAGRRAVVVGGGIGGLAAAVGLARTGWRVVVCERAPALEPVGTGLVLWPNGVAALGALGLDDSVHRVGRALGGTGLRRPSGLRLSQTDSRQITRRHGRGLVAVARPELVDVLARALPEGVLRLGTTVTAVRPGDEHAPAEVVCGSDTLVADLVVAADGIGSAVRRSLWPEHPVAGYRGYTTWRALVGTTGLDLGGSATETWGRGERFGIVPLAGDRTYVYGTAAATARTLALDPATELAELRRRFGGWHSPIPELLDRLSSEDLLRHDVLSLEPPVRRLTTGRVVLLGDAAHGMEPNLGQGACLALEDAVTLTAIVAGSPVTSAPDGYTAARGPRAARLSRQSRLIGYATRTRSRALTTVRDAAVRCTPAALSLRGFDDAARWRPPPLALGRPPAPDRGSR